MTISAATRLAVVLGDPVEHSLSPALHNAAFAAAGVDACFLACRVAPGELETAAAGLRALGFLGASVTVPHKRAVMTLCDRVDDLASAIGAVNCLAIDRDGSLVGHNTDASGFVDSLVEAGVSVDGRQVVLLGSGGAARAVAAGLHQAGASSITVVARDPATAGWVRAVGRAVSWTGGELEPMLLRCDALVDCTPVSLNADTDGRYPVPVAIDVLPASAVVASLVYHREPALLRDAAARGLPTVTGAGMLVHQGARAFRLWTGIDAPVEVMWSAMRAALAKRK